jgi:hypothetical protein
MMAVVIVFLFVAARRLEHYGAFVGLRFVQSGELGRCEGLEHGIVHQNGVSGIVVFRVGAVLLLWWWWWCFWLRLLLKGR